MIHTLIRWYRRFRYFKYGWFGDFANWQLAKNKCTGYHTEAILDKVKSATLKVQRGEAVYERDGLLYDKKQYSWPLLTHLLWIAMENDEKLSVVDFGGSLGSSYFQNKNYLEQLKEFQWSVVEQNEFVAAGQHEIGDGRLGFYYSIDDAIEADNHQVLLLSCVLPYLEEPLQFLHNLLPCNFTYIIIDNTYFNPVAGNRLTIQKVPPLYYDASYPAWFLDYDEVKNSLKSKYNLVEEYTNEQFLYLYGEKINYRGIVLKLKQ